MRLAVWGAMLCLTVGVARAQPVLGQLRPPVEPACISSPFGMRHAMGIRPAAFHNGIDFPAPVGAIVHAAASGTIVGVRRLGAEGLEVTLQHGGFQTRYAHLGTVTPAIAEGRRQVAQGDALGRVGRTGVTYGTHVHFEVIVGGKPIDGEPLFAVPRCH